MTGRHDGAGDRFALLRGITQTVSVAGTHHMEAASLAAKRRVTQHLPHSAHADGTMNGTHKVGLSKVPEVTLAFWIIKIGATTLGETAGDALSMTMHLGYALSSGIFAACFDGRGRGPGQGQGRSTVPVLGCHPRHHHGRHDDGGFRRPVPGDRLSRAAR